MVTAHELRVGLIEPLTDDSFLLGFAVPPQLRDAFAYRAGQYVTIQTELTPGNLERRSYSICRPPRQAWPDDPDADGLLVIGVKVLPGGRFSEWARDHLRVGDTLTVLTPTGRFTVRDDSPGRSYGALVAGSGITPVMALVGDVLETNPTATFVLHLINRGPDQVMFARHLEQAQRRWPDRLRVVHHWSRTPGPDGTAAGRITDDALVELLRTETADGVSEWFLCGPQPLVVRSQAALAELGIGRRLVHTELFHTG
ncbi:MAG TPA: hypothetical protein IAA98_05585 [Candidatus Avipropionibacterium avicola]|uniref:FAD-binding FR-type domain-containing protein n=1 Tax=Candidatus Avipropionibacterium avicola TaxID=2840701 RepID=A0A9D1GWH8_9ACTN|nr:hypothetical protein [Candidatus Avipropionibacterium avicola]